MGTRRQLLLAAAASFAPLILLVSAAGPLPATFDVDITS